MESDIRLKRAYVPWSEEDGFRVLVDRVWPRGVSREVLNADLWLVEVAPSAELRKWFDHDPDRWEGFRHRYRQELELNCAAVTVLRDRLDKGRLTLVYGAKDELHNQAVVLRDYILAG